MRQNINIPPLIYSPGSSRLTGIIQDGCVFLVSKQGCFYRGTGPHVPFGFAQGSRDDREEDDGRAESVLNGSACITEADDRALCVIYEKNM